MTNSSHPKNKKMEVHRVTSTLKALDSHLPVFLYHKLSWRFCSLRRGEGHPLQYYKTECILYRIKIEYQDEILTFYVRCPNYNMIQKF